MDRRPSFDDSSLRTLDVIGGGADGGSGDVSDSNSSESEVSRTSSGLVENPPKAGGGWLSGFMKRDPKKDDDAPRESPTPSAANGSGVMKSDSEFDESTSSENATPLPSRSSLSSTLIQKANMGRDLLAFKGVPSFRRSVNSDDTDDLVRPYHRAFHNNERPSFLRRSPMGSVRIMGTDEMYHSSSSSAKSPPDGIKGVGVSGGAEQKSSGESSNSYLSSSSRSTGDLDISKFSAYKGSSSKTSNKPDANEVTVVKTKRKRRLFLALLSVTVAALVVVGGMWYVLRFEQDDKFHTSYLRTSAQSIFGTNRETEETVHFATANMIPSSSMISSTSSELEDCISNGHFDESPATSHWYPVQSDMQVTDSYESGEHALLSTDRTNARNGGLWQNIRSDCLRPNEWYEVQADVLLRHAGTEETVDCDPSIPWSHHERSCPSIALKTNLNGVQDIAWTVGPASTSTHHFGWYRLYGAFRPTADMLQDQIAVIVARAPIAADILVDNIHINPANEYTVGVIQDCEDPSLNLVANGNADTGDHRFWFIRGNGGEGGHIEVHHTERGYAFRHAGYRSERWRGMLQSLDATCITPHSTWQISAMFRYFVTNEHGIDVPQVCDKSNPMAPDSCPVFELQFVSLKHTSTDNGAGNMALNTGPMVNEDTEEFVLGDWNRIVHTITVSEDMAMQSEVWLYVQSVAKGFNYELDDVEMLPLV